MPSQQPFSKRCIIMSFWSNPILFDSQVRSQEFLCDNWRIKVQLTLTCLQPAVILWRLWIHHGVSLWAAYGGRGLSVTTPPLSACVSCIWPSCMSAFASSTQFFLCSRFPLNSFLLVPVVSSQCMMELLILLRFHLASLPLAPSLVHFLLPPCAKCSSSFFNVSFSSGRTLDFGISLHFWSCSIFVRMVPFGLLSLQLCVLGFCKVVFPSSQSLHLFVFWCEVCSQCSCYVSSWPFGFCYSPDVLNSDVVFLSSRLVLDPDWPSVGWICLFPASVPLVGCDSGLFLQNPDDWQFVQNSLRKTAGQRFK